MNTRREPADLRFPIGEFSDPGRLDANQRASAIDRIAAAPADLRAAVSGLSRDQLDTPYRPDGWTVRQVVHHLPDSHFNSFMRFKLGLTENQPLVRTYREELWAELPDAAADIEVSLRLLDALHARWVILLSGIRGAEWDRTIRHPDLGVMTLDVLLAFYAWHGDHHVAHLTRLRERRGW